MEINFDYMFTMEEVDKLLRGFGKIHRPYIECEKCNKKIEVYGSFDLFGKTKLLCIQCIHPFLNPVYQVRNIITNLRYPVKLEINELPTNIDIIYTWGYDSGEDYEFKGDHT